MDLNVGEELQLMDCVLRYPWNRFSTNKNSSNGTFSKSAAIARCLPIRVIRTGVGANESR